MSIIGKIFVFAVFVMSLVFMAFSVAIYSSHTNYKADIERSSEEVALNDKHKTCSNLHIIQKEICT